MPLSCPAITLTAGAVLKQEKMSSIVGERHLGGILRDNLGEGNGESKIAARQTVSGESIFAARPQDASQGPLGFQIIFFSGAISCCRRATGHPNKKGTRGVQPGYDAELPPLISFARHFGHPIMSGMDSQGREYCKLQRLLGHRLRDCETHQFWKPKFSRIANLPPLSPPKNAGALRKGPPFHASRSSREMKIQNASCQMGGCEVAR